MSGREGEADTGTGVKALRCHGRQEGSLLPWKKGEEVVVDRAVGGCDDSHGGWLCHTPQGWLSRHFEGKGTPRGLTSQALAPL